MRYTETKQEVPVPSWAESYDVGDQIEFKNPITGKPEMKKVVGFSTIHKNIGLPVVNKPQDIKYKEVAITKEYHLNGHKK